MDKPVIKYLERIYSNPSNPASYGSVDKLYRQVKKEGKYPLTRAQIKQWLSTQLSYTLYKPVKRKFSRRRVISPFIGFMYDADTCNMSRYGKENQGYEYILGLIDTHSKKAHTRPLKTLQSEEVANALKDILDKEIVKIVNLRTDMGTEFAGPVKKLLSDRNINHILASNTETKSNQIERWWLTLKRMITAWMTKNNSHAWKDQLENFTSNYNQSFHRSIQQSPASVSEKDEVKIWKLLYEQVPKGKRKAKSPPKRATPYKYKLNDVVRTTVIRNIFMRGFDESFARPHYVIYDRFRTQDIPQYRLKTIFNKKIPATFYQSELQRVRVSKNEVYTIDKILKSKGSGSNKMSLVSWIGFGPEYNTYIKHSDIIKYQT